MYLGFHTQNLLTDLYLLFIGIWVKLWNTIRVGGKGTIDSYYHKHSSATLSHFVVDRTLSRRSQSKERGRGDEREGVTQKKRLRYRNLRDKKVYKLCVSKLVVKTHVRRSTPRGTDPKSTSRVPKYPLFVNRVIGVVRCLRHVTLWDLRRTRTFLNIV